MTLASDRQNVQKFATTVVDQVQSTMYGVDGVIRLCLVALYVKGHVLLEGNPGLGKTSLVNTLAKTLNLPFRRIQFTPDLLPSDITTTPKLSHENGGTRIELAPGPIFTSLLLADEINRATQKTQSALLEAMGERQVTVNGETTRLDADGAPFMVLATQNPVDHEGTYDLPEAQLDRFLFKVLMPTPNSDAIERILRKTAGVLSGGTDGDAAELTDPPPLENRAQTVERFKLYHGLIRQVRPQPSVQAHIENLFQATNGQMGALRSNREASAEVLRLQGQLRYGLGPRAATALLISAKAWTLLFSLPTVRLGDADIVVSADALAAVALPVLRHRLKLKYSALDEYRKKASAGGEEGAIDAFTMDLLRACIPSGPGMEPEYGRAFVKALERIQNEHPY